MVLMPLSGVTCAEVPADRHWAQVEHFFSTIRSTARLDPSTTTAAPGRGISLEDDLGLADRKGTPYLQLGMRLGERGRLEFEYFRLDRSASVMLSRQIQWGDVDYRAAAQIDSLFDTAVYRLSGGYSLHRTSDAEFGGALGLHVTHFAVSLAGQGTGPAGTGFQSDRRTELVPLPTLGLYGTFMMSDRWMLRGRFDYLSLDHNGYDGSMVNAMASIGYRLLEHVGAGVGYRFVDYKLRAEKVDFRGEVNYRFKGPTVYLEAAF
jgi:hypothetical protein